MVIDYCFWFYFQKFQNKHRIAYKEFPIVRKILKFKSYFKGIIFGFTPAICFVGFLDSFVYRFFVFIEI